MCFYYFYCITIILILYSWEGITMKELYNKIEKIIINPIFILLLLSVVIRIFFMSYMSIDYNVFLKGWYETILENGGVHALKMTIGNYPDSYMFILAIGSYITKNALIYIKIISILLDGLIAFFGYRIYQHFKVKDSKIKGIFLLLIPGVFINSAILGQCDGIYSAFLLMFLYYILKEKPKRALFFFGVAFSFKLQALFIAPIMLYLLLTKRIKIYELFWCVLGFMVPLIPSLIWGRGLVGNLQVLLSQTSQYNNYVKSCPNIYSMLFLNYKEMSIVLKYVLSGIVITIATVIVLLGNKKTFSEKTFMKKILLLTMIVPFLLPGMLDRYFYFTNIVVVLYYTIWENKFTKRFITVASIGFALPVMTTNFLFLTEKIAYTADYIVVSIISTPLVIYFIIHSIALHIQDWKSQKKYETI